MIKEEKSSAGWRKSIVRAPKARRLVYLMYRLSGDLGQVACG